MWLTIYTLKIDVTILNGEVNTTLSTMEISNPVVALNPQVETEVETATIEGLLAA